VTLRTARFRDDRTNSEPSPVKGTRLRVRALGACLITAGKTRIKPDSAVLFALALYLGVRAGERVTRADVLELLWPGVAPTARRHALRQLLYRLKRSGVPLDADGDELSPRPDTVECDVTALLRDDWPASVALADVPSVSTVLPSYHPDVTDAFHAWVDDLRARCGAQIRTAALRHVASARREGRWADLERVARICIETDPLNEEATLALGESVAMSGSKAEALRLLDAYLWELGDRNKTIGLPARLLRRRISEQPVYRAPRAGEPPLIARADDIAWLNAKLDETSVGQCCTAMLLGPPGIGKTAVVRAFVSHAEMRGWRFIESRLQPSDVDRPMSVFVELFPALLKASGALGAAPESIAQLRRLIEFHVVDDILANKSQEAEAVQARIRESTLDLLDAVTHEGPLVLVLEDLHWVDRQSLRLLTWLLEHATKAPVLWLLTARMEGRFADLREVLPADRVPSRTIEPLGRSSAMALFRACIPEAQRDTGQPVPEHAYDVTGGNPLFIREVAGHWAETGGTEALPGNLKSLMRGRVARLPAAAQRVLHCCAVLGRFASVPRVSVVLEISTTELLACIEEVDGLGLLGLGGEPGSLALHDLWQEELISTLRPASRALLHLRCGEVLATESSESKLASMVSDAARHLIAAGVRERALRLLEDAAAHQLANGLSEDAVGSLEQAIASCLGDEDRLRLEQHRITALLTIGGWQKIAASVDAILLLHRKVDRLATEHSALELIAIESTMLAGMDLHETIARASRCARSSNADDLHRATAARLGARAASNVAEAEWLAAFGSLANKLDRTKPAVLAQVLGVETVFHTDLGSIDQAIRVSSELIEIERSAGAIRGLIRALRYRAIPLRITSSFDEAIAVARESFELAVKHRIADDAAAGADMLATILFETGDLKSARTWLEHAEPWVKRVSASYARTSANVTRAMIALEAGDVDEAAAHTPLDLEAISKNPVLRFRMSHLSIAARILLARNDLVSLGKCAKELRRALEQARPFRRNEYFIASLALVSLAIDSPDAARRIVSDFSESTRNDRLAPWRELALFR
jgi:DNA-binding SARP family transcriptional activator